MKITERQYLDALTTVRAYLKQVDEELPKVKQIDFDTLFYDLGWSYHFKLSIKARTLLNDFGIYTLRDLVKCSRSNLSRVQGIGTKTLNEIDDFMKLHGVEFGMLDK